jgi:GH24 family phage-related lysozyme (muramidase)
MKTSLKGKMFLTGLEGICLTKYLDSVNVWTVGVGATKTEIPDLASWPREKSLTIPECFDLLEESLEDYEEAVNRNLKVRVTQEQFDALVSICYNIGTGGLARSTFIKRINAGYPVGNVQSFGELPDLPLEYTRTERDVVYEEQEEVMGLNNVSIVSAIMMWNKPKEIIGRRMKEAVLFSRGVYAGNERANVFPVSANFRPLYSKGKIINLREYFEDSPAPRTEPKVEQKPEVPSTSVWDKITSIFSDWLKG